MHLKEIGEEEDTADSMLVSAPYTSSMLTAALLPGIYASEVRYSVFQSSLTTFLGASVRLHLSSVQSEGCAVPGNYAPLALGRTVCDGS